MANTVLGPSTGPTMTVVNTSTSAIPAGRCVRWNNDAEANSITRISPEEVGLLGVEVLAISTTREALVGVTVANIDPGDTGLIVIWGMVLCETDATVAFQESVKPGAGGVMVDAAATAAESHGVALETKRDDPVPFDTSLGGGARTVAYCLIVTGVGQIDTVGGTTERTHFGGGA